MSVIFYTAFVLPLQGTNRSFKGPCFSSHRINLQSQCRVHKVQVTGLKSSDRSSWSNEFLLRGEVLVQEEEEEELSNLISGQPNPSDDEKEQPSFEEKVSSVGSTVKKRRARVTALLSQGMDPIQVLETMPKWSPTEFWEVVDYLASQNRLNEVLKAFSWWKGQKNYRPREQHYITYMRIFGIAKQPEISQELFNEMISIGIQPSFVGYTVLLQSYAESGLFDTAEKLLNEMAESGVRPNAATYNGLIHAYGKQGRYDDMNRLFNNMKRRGFVPDNLTYSYMIAAYAKAGLFRRMESILREMDGNGWKLDARAINAMIQGYSTFGLVQEMHDSYIRMKDYRVLISRKSILAMSTVYIRSSKFHQLRLFVKDVGLKRNNVGNLLWNLFLLSFAARFQMKNLDRAFKEMAAAGFKYDLTTFNIRALGFSRMHMFWELHVTLIQMQKAGIKPDMVTFGAVVDAYISGRERFQKMFEELDELQMKGLCPDVRTDPFVFEAFGKGEFHSSSETLMQINPKPYGSDWTYGLLTSFYLRKRVTIKPPRDPRPTREKNIHS